MNHLYLYTTIGCHLCEQAQAIAAPIAARYQLDIALVDIADSDELMARYGVLIPVLALAATGQELRWPFSGAEVEQLLAG